MYGLVDATTFYSSAEKVFDANIRNRAVVVLTNNDGCVAAACGLAKLAGIGKKFRPYFQIKDDLVKAGAVVRSSNYELYADLSSRMMATCERFAPESFVYSIDEIFLRFPSNSFSSSDWIKIAKTIRRAVWKEVRLPTGVGFGETPTLAKAASHAAKRIEGFRGVAVIHNEESRKFILNRMDVTDVWGIGSRTGKKLHLMGIKSAMDLSNQDPTKMRKYFSILIENTVRELCGETRLSFDSVRPSKKEIYSTRSFGQRISCKVQLGFSLAKHAETVSAKLRKQGSIASGVSVFAHSSPHDAEPFYRKNVYIPFAVPTQDTRVIVAATNHALKSIFKPHIRFFKSGVGLMDIQDATHYQEDLFSPSLDNPKLMDCLDSINSRFGRGTATLAATGKTHTFAMKREMLSPQYTTNWKHIPRIKC